MEIISSLLIFKIEKRKQIPPVQGIIVSQHLCGGVLQDRKQKLARGQFEKNFRQLRHFLLTALCLSLAACSKAPTSTTASTPQPSASATGPVPGDWVVSAMLDDPDTLNPVTAETQNAQDVLGNIFEGLLTEDNYTLAIKPLLALSWEISPDKLVFTFHLRPDVKWQDGVPFTAEDVKYTFDRIQDPKVDAANIRTSLTAIKDCTVLDPYTVRFTADHPYFQTLTALGFSIVPKHLFAQNLNLSSSQEVPNHADFNQNPFGRHPIGTGPYRFISWTTGSRIVLQRNDDYWGEKKAYPDRLVYQIIQDQSTTLQLLKKGDLDLMEGIPAINWKRQLEHSPAMKRLSRQVYAYPSYSYVGFNLRRPLFSDVRVRHALDLLIPRQSILDKVFLNQYALLCSGYDAIGSPSYNHNVPPTPHDPQLALQLLREAGWTRSPVDGRLHNASGEILQFTLLYNSGNEQRQKILELIQEAYQEVGIEAHIQKMEFAQMIARINDWNYDAVMAGWALPLDSDPYALWHSSQADIKASDNFIGYKNPAVDQLIEAGRAEYDLSKRTALFQQVHQIVHNDYPACFLFNPRVILVHSNRFENVKTFAPRPCFDITEWSVPKARQKYTEISL